MPIFTTHDKQGRKSVNFSYISGMPAPWCEGAPANLTIDAENNRLIITSRLYDWQPVSLPFKRIYNVELFSENETVEKSKSVIKRGIAGALIAGPVGAVVGGMSGIGSKTKTQTRRGLAIDFITKNGDRSLIFEIVGATYDADGFAAELLACVRQQRAKSSETPKAQPPKRDMTIPRKFGGAPRAYLYHVKINLLDNSVLDKMANDRSWELVPEISGEKILLKNRGSVLGELVERTDMLRDWIQRGDPYMIIFEKADETSNCTVVLAFYKDKRKYWSYREQSVVSLARYAGEDAQTAILLCENGDELEIEEDENGKICVCNYGETIGCLPEKYAQRYLEEDASGVFFEAAELNDSDKYIPSVRIYW